jgi:hypothetical protein
MKRTSKAGQDPNVLREYNFRPGKRGKYARRYARGANIVILDPDVAAHFSDSRSVNDALRSFAGIGGRKKRAAQG